MQIADAPPTSLGHALETVASRYPNELAVHSQRFRLSYAELLQGARRIAASLTSAGGANGHVGVLAEHDAPGIAGLYGAFATGAVCVPLDPAWPAARIGDILQDAEVCTLLVDAASIELARAATARSNLKLVCLEEALSDAEEIGPWDEDTVDDELACILYTSGSTGRPKGVMHTHRSLLRGTDGMIEAVNVRKTDRLTLLAPLAYAAPLSQMLVAHLSGAALVPFDVRRNGVAPLANWIAETGVTVYHSVAAVWRELLAGLIDPGFLSSLRLLRLGGGPTAPADAAVLQRLPQHCQVWTNYAATEHWLGLYSLVDGNTRLDQGLPHIPLRTAMPGVDVLLVDDSDQPVADGEPGEIVVASDTLAKGYWRHPELTDERFGPDPRTGYGRIYRTGDLARRLADGAFLHMGRRDDVVKIRGMRVEPAEVEAVLARHPLVREVAVLATQDVHGSPALAGYVAPRNGSELTLTEVQRFAVEHLLSAMVPSRYALVERLPRASHGKVDRATLRTIPTAVPLGGGGEPPNTPTEWTLAQIWGEVLGTEDLGLQDDFFELGGHSLLAARLLVRVEDAFGLRLPLTSLFPDATLGAMARRVEREQVDAADILVPLQTAGSLPPLICVHPIDGDVMRFAALARELGSDQPFYGLRAPGLFDKQACYDDVSQLATLYASRVRKAFNGPFYLAGFSFGGIVAVETARALQNLGERAAFVGLLDAPAPGFSLPDSLRMLPADVLAYAQYKLRVARSQGWRAALVVKDLLETIGEFSAEHLAVAVAHRRALRRVRPVPFRGKVVVFRAQARRLLSSHSPTIGWSRLAAGGAEVRMVPGMHEEMFRQPHVRTLATELGAALASARAELASA